MDESSTDPVASVRITADLPCFGCRYNLRTLPIASSCPECGRAVGDTLGVWGGDPDLCGVSSLRRAARVLAWTPVAGTAIGLLSGVAITIARSWAVAGLVGLVAVLFVALYLVASLHFVNSACALRRSKVNHEVWIGIALLSVGVGYAVRHQPGAVTIGLVAMALVAAAAWTASHAGRIARRVGDEALARSARTCVRAGAGSLTLLILLMVFLLLPATGAPGSFLAYARMRGPATPIVMLAAALCTGVTSVGLMFRLTRWLARAAPVADYLRRVAPDRRQPPDGERPQAGS